MTETQWKSIGVSTWSSLSNAFSPEKIAVGDPVVNCFRLDPLLEDLIILIRGLGINEALSFHSMLDD